jgi:DeoR family fructose operon transcriptional repressor
MIEEQSGLIPAERKLRIQKIIRSQGVVRVSRLSTLLGVSQITIRRDLEQLEEEGVLERTHGGAIMSQRLQLEHSFTEKDNINREAKRCIGMAAAQLVEDGDTLLINSGSTTLQIFPNLVGIKNLRVITSNLGAFLETREIDLELILTGGIFREQSNSLIGSFALHNIQKVFGNKCFIGVDGISRKHGLTTPILEEAEVARTMIERTKEQVIVVADPSKLGVVSNFVTASIDQVNTLVTYQGKDDEYLAGLEEEGIEIIIAPSSLDNSGLKRRRRGKQQKTGVGL